MCMCVCMGACVCECLACSCLLVRSLCLTDQPALVSLPHATVFQWRFRRAWPYGDAAVSCECASGCDFPQPGRRALKCSDGCLRVTSVRRGVIAAAQILFAITVAYFTLIIIIAVYVKVYETALVFEPVSASSCSGTKVMLLSPAAQSSCACAFERKVSCPCARSIYCVRVFHA